jgi:hypothetical protein
VQISKANVAVRMNLKISQNFDFVDLLGQKLTKPPF